MIQKEVYNLEIVSKIIVDMAMRGIPPVINAVQGETNTRKVEISLIANGVQWIVPNETTIAIAFLKPDGTSGLYDQLPDTSSASVVSGNIVTITLAPQVLTVYGDVTASVIFYDENMNTLATFPFKIFVEQNPSFGESVSNNYYALQNLDQINKAYNDLVGRGSVHIGSTQPTDGTLYWLDTSEDEDEEVVVTLTGISATYSGGDVAEGTALSDLTGIVVTATYSDGSTKTVTDYTLSGTTAEGSNTITVTYEGMTATFTVTGIAEEEPTVTYTITNNLTDCVSSNSATSVAENASYTATITANDGYELSTATVTMGGTDVTSTVYANGVITISAVTGNVVITAVAAEKLNVVELKPDYMTFTYYRVTMADTAPTNLAEDMPETLNLVAKINTKNSYGGSCTLSVRDTGWTATKTNIEYTRQILTVDENLYAVVTVTKEAYMTAYEEWLANIDSGLIAYGGTFQLGGASNNFYSSYLVRAIAGTIDENVIRHLERTWEEVTT